MVFCICPMLLDQYILLYFLPWSRSTLVFNYAFYTVFDIGDQVSHNLSPSIPFSSMFWKTWCKVVSSFRLTEFTQKVI